MKNGDRIGRELRTVLRSGGLPKQKPNSSRPNLTLDLSKGVLGFASLNEHKFEKLSSSRGQRTPNQHKVFRPVNKENDPSAYNATERTARSKDVLDSYRTARNLHNLNKDDIFKKLRKEESSEACSLASHSKAPKPNPRSLGNSSHPESRAYRLDREAVISSIKKLERSADVAKKIDFSLNSLSLDRKKKCKSSIMMRSDLQESAQSRRGAQDSTSKTIGSLKKALFGNQMDVFGRRNRAVEYLELPGGEFSGPDSNELVNKWRRKRQTTDNITESSIKPFGSLHEGTGLTGLTVSDVSRVFATEEESHPASHPDSAMMLLEDQRHSALGPGAAPPGEKDPLSKLSNPARAANLESMKTIKEAEEREEMMGYTSQKETLNGGHLQGSFQNLLDKYCGNRESVVILDSEAKSARFLRSTLLQEERRKFEEVREMIEQECLENNLEEAELYTSCEPQDKPQTQVQVVANAQFTTSSSRPPASPAESRRFEEASRRDQYSDRREPEKRRPLEPLDQNSVLTRKDFPQQTPKDQELLAKKEAAIDAELDKILKNLDRESQEAQQAYRRQQPGGAAFRRLEAIEDPGVLRKIIRDLELENRERETELIHMNMQVQDLSRLARVLVRKVKSAQSRACY